MDKQLNEPQDYQQAPALQSVQSELNALKRKYSRLQKENENVLFLYKQAAALRDYNEREKEIQMHYNQMLRDNCPDDIFLLDMKQIILLCTSSVKKRLGRDITGEQFFSFVNEEFGEGFSREIDFAIKELLCTGENVHIESELNARELHVETAGNPKKFYSFRIHPALDNRGGFTGIVVLAHDNTDMHNANVRAETATQAKSSFLSNMSHEIRTPLNAILGMTKIGISAGDIERKDYCLLKIEDASNHLLGVINDVLDISKVEAGKFELSDVKFNFEKMLERVVNVISFRIDEKQLRLTVHIDNAIPKYMLGDDQRIALVITNLVGNAVKFTPNEGAITLSTYFLGEADGVCSIQIEVSDTGIGIREEQQARLFSSFQQAESNTVRQFGGTGLGLAISKNIVEMMGGSIWIESKLGKGATFAFTLKLKKSDIPEQDNVLSGVEWSSVRILTVDDDPDVLAYMKKFLQGFGANCDTAKTGEEALRLVELNGCYDIYFVDLKMPGMDGIELTRALKGKASDIDNIIVIMISSSEWNEIKDEAKSAGVNKFLSKPVFPSAIVDIISEHLGIIHKVKNEKQEEIFNFAGKRILLAEDVEINCEIVLALLEPTNLQIDCAKNGTEVVRMFKEAPERYDMIFMDIQMPEMDGYEATRAIRNLGIRKAKVIPIVAMTANVFREEIEKCLASGMNDHLGKPLDYDEVLSKLQIYLGLTS